MNEVQDGLEVHYPQAGLEVVPMQNQKWAHHYQDDSQDQPSPLNISHDPPRYSQNDKEVVVVAPNSKLLLQSKRKLWLVITVVSLIIIAAVLGSALGTTLHHQKQNSPSKPTNTPSATASGGLPRIREKSPLAVTGWLTGSDYSIRAVFLSDDDMIQYISYESKNNTWTQTSNITKAKAGSPLALTSFDTSWYGTVTPQTQFNQVELFFLDPNNRLHEWAFDNTASTLGSSGSLTPYTFPTASDSHLASYWPFIVYQDANLTLHEVVYDCTVAGCWFNRTLNLTGYNGTGIVILPKQQNQKELNILYQSGDQQLMSVDRSSVNGNLSAAPPFSIDLPASASIAAFVTLRPLSNNTLLNTYILYQDSAGIIQVVWNDDNSGWKGPVTFPAFEGADNGTSIACLTQATYFTASPLQPDSPLSRCYFQVKGALREVRLDASNGVVPGDVEITP